VKVRETMLGEGALKESWIDVTVGTRVQRAIFVSVGGGSCMKRRK
jgi:hypothetical protein